MGIEYVKHSEINFEKWDQMVRGFEYGYISDESFFLNTFGKWDALIVGDYEGGMALPYIRRFGIKKLYQPFFSQRCTWFGTNADTTNKTIFQHIKKHFYLLHFNTNIEPNIGRLSVKQRTNYTLSLEKSYEDMVKNFSKSVRKRLQKNSGLDIILETKNLDSDALIDLYRKAYGDLNPQLKEIHYQKLKSIIQLAEEKSQILSIKVFSSNELVAGLMFFHYKNKLVYALGAPTQRGRKMNALTFAFAYLIKKFENTSQVIDFEGSNIPSVAGFYASFGAEKSYFYEIVYRMRFVKCFFALK
jgi:hypothetical protein